MNACEQKRLLELAVHCCHVEVGQKHWLYPPAGLNEPRIPLEFAYGELKVNDVSGGCDLRPMDPTKPEAAAANLPCSK